MIELQLNDLMSKKYPLGVRFSNMHLLARQRCLKPTPDYKSAEPLILTYKIEHLRRWHNTCNIYSKQNQLSQIMTDLDHRYENTLVHLPKLELARALFFIMHTLPVMCSIQNFWMQSSLSKKNQRSLHHS